MKLDERPISRGVAPRGRRWRRQVLLTNLRFLGASVPGRLALAIDMRLLSTTVMVHAIVFASIGFCAQGVQNGRQVYVRGMAPKDIRPHCITVANFSTGLIAVWLIYVVIVLNLLALAAIARLRGGRPERR